MSKQNISFFIFLVIVFFFQNCENEPTESIHLSTFEGESQAIEKAETMFKALGGKEVWAKLKSLYIHAIHEEPNLEHPYKSHIWRDLDALKMRIEQRGPEFDVIGLFSEKKIEIQYLHRDSMRWFSEDALESEHYAHEHNVYVLFKKMATTDSILVKLDEEGRLDFFQKDEWMCGFILDDQNRPHRFFSPNVDGTDSESLFKIWNTIEGLIHPAGGGPVDGDFEYKTQIWRPSNENIETAFDVEYESKSFEMSNLDWLTGKWKRERKNGVIYEEWMKEDDKLVGKSYSEKGNEIQISETLELSQMDGETFYTPTVLNQNDGNPIPFKLLGAFENRFIFLNSEHDFPQKIVYRKIGNDSLKVTISGPSDEEWQKIDFNFEKID